MALDNDQTPKVSDMHPGTIHQLISEQAATRPGAIALLGEARGPLTYAQLDEHIAQTGRRLNEMGIGRGDRVAIVLPNGPEMATAFLAIGSFATSAPLNPNYRAMEFDFYLEDLDAAALMILDGMDSPAVAVAESRHVPVIRLKSSKASPAGIFELIGETVAREITPGPAQSDDVALVLHTSGTTSRPKIVPLSHGNLCASARNIRQTLELTEADRCMNVMPLFHIHGLVAATLSSLSAGASVACTPGFVATQFFDWLDAFEPTWYTAVPTMHQAILTRAEAHADVIARRPLRFVRSSSSALPPQVMAQLERVFSVPCVEAYGMTEAAHQMCCNPLPPAARKPGSVGPAAGPQVAIMDDAGHLLDSGETGEIVIKGPNVTAGYANNPEANTKAFTNGWFRTGDQGHMDDDGYVFLTGRLKELILRGGENISPREIDEVLMDHPSVAQAVAFAMPHRQLGEDVAAAVVLREGQTADEASLRAHAAAQLADFKVPRRIVIVDQIPKGPTGKLQRIGLAEKLGVGGTDGAAGPADYVEPAEGRERALADIWQDVLRVERVGARDNFFDLGGDSVLASQVIARVEQQGLGRLAMLKFFESPVLTDMAGAILDADDVDAMLDELENMTDEQAQRLLAEEQ